MSRQTVTHSPEQDMKLLLSCQLSSVLVTSGERLSWEEGSSSVVLPEVSYFPWSDILRVSSAGWRSEVRGCYICTVCQSPVREGENSE